MRSPTGKRLKSWFRDRATQIVTSSPGLTKSVLRKAGSPSLFELYQSAGSWHVEAKSLLATLPEAPQVPDSLLASAQTLSESITERSLAILRKYPNYFEVEHETRILLYAVVRAIRPQVVLETGVADGLSSAVILDALSSNTVGELHSIDISDDVGSLIIERSAWRLHVISEHCLESDLRRVATTVGPIDIFFHDANHDYHHQMIEYETFWPAMAPGGVFLSDDVDCSYAFLDFADRVGRRPTMLLDGRKVLGMIRR